MPLPSIYRPGGTGFQGGFGVPAASPISTFGAAKVPKFYVPSASPQPSSTERSPFERAQIDATNALNEVMQQPGRIAERPIALANVFTGGAVGNVLKGVGDAGGSNGGPGPIGGFFGAIGDALGEISTWGSSIVNHKDAALIGVAADLPDSTVLTEDFVRQRLGVPDTGPLNMLTEYSKNVGGSLFMVSDPHPTLRATFSRGEKGQDGRGARPIKTTSRKSFSPRTFGTDYPTPDGTGVRDYIHVTDLARAHLDALEYLRDGGASTVFNCGYGHGYSVRDVLEAVGRASGTPVPCIEAPRRPGDPPSLVAVADRIRATLGWRPRHDDLDLIASTALAWERKIAMHVH